MDRVIFMHEKAENVLIVLYTRIFAGLSVRGFCLLKWAVDSLPPPWDTVHLSF
jgi:hypothetical protein